MVVDFNIIIQIVTTDPKNETTIADKKPSSFKQRLKKPKMVIPKSKFVVVKLVLYKFLFKFRAGFDIS